MRSLLQLSYPENEPDVFLQKAGVVFDRAPLFLPPCRIQPVPANHGEIEAYGYLIETNALSLYYSGDTALTAAVESAVSRSDISILDVTTIDLPLETHMNLRDAVRLAESCRDGQSLFAVHRTFPEPNEHHERLIFPDDGSVYRLEQGRSVQLRHQ